MSDNERDPRLHPVFWVDTSNWSPARHVAGWIFYICGAALVGWAGSSLVAWLNAL